MKDLSALIIGAGIAGLTSAILLGRLGYDVDMVEKDSDWSVAGIGAHPEDVMHMKRTADRLFGDNYRWSVLAAGSNQMPVAAQAAAMGGDRVNF